MGVGDEEGSACMNEETEPWGPIKDSELLWHHTPWWNFWRPKWRRFERAGAYFNGNVYKPARWEFASDKQRARQVLEERCDPDCPTRQADSSGRYRPQQFHAIRK